MCVTGYSLEFLFSYNRFYTPPASDQKLTLGNIAAFACGEKHPKAIYLDRRANASMRACSLLSKLVEKSKFLSPLRGTALGVFSTVLTAGRTRCPESCRLKLQKHDTRVLFSGANWHVHIISGRWCGMSIRGLPGNSPAQTVKNERRSSWLGDGGGEASISVEQPRTSDQQPDNTSSKITKQSFICLTQMLPGQI